MKSLKKRFLQLLILITVLTLWGFTGFSAVLAQEKDTDEALARRYAPVLYFHPDEVFKPQSVSVLLDSARLRVRRTTWFDHNILLSVSFPDLVHYQDENYFLDAWFGSEKLSEYKNFTFHRQVYQQRLSPEAGGPQVSAYAHVSRQEEHGFITIQYWLFYYYNDWFNKHEGDWEMVQVVLDGKQQPVSVVLSQHHGGTRRPWDWVQVEEGSHPTVYVALGSHANYFWGDEIYPNARQVGNQQMVVMDRTGISGRVMPEIEMIPEPESVRLEPDLWRGSEWVLFGGHWGETAQQSNFAGPIGPAFRGEVWESPLEWGNAQPLDTETWYANRLRVEVSGGSGSVRLQSSLDDTLSEAEFSEGLALLHRDPFPGEKLSTVIRVRQKQPFNLKVRYPDPQDSRVAEFKFGSITAAGSVRLTMSASGVSLLTNPGDVEGIAPDSNLTTTEIWDVPDVVWIGGILPVNQILIGLMLSLLMGWLPALVMSFLLYWSDRYEKEPLPLLAVTFLWGALPALIAAFLLRLFVSTSIDLTSSAAFGTGLLGWVEAITEESLKAIIVLWVAHRYRREFDNVLDGVIYGGMVGIGFAMNANIISYLGSFLSRGFDGLNAHILINGILFCINHALFTAIFGAGLGYARLFPSNRRNWVIPSSAFLISIAARTTHDWINLRGIGFNFGNFIFTTLSMVGLVLVVIQSLRRQRLCLEVELLDQVPAEVYQTLLHPVRRFQAQVSTFRQGGVRAWRNQRRLFQLCAEYAFKRQQVRMHPGESVTAAEAERLKEEIGRLLEKE